VAQPPGPNFPAPVDADRPVPSGGTTDGRATSLAAADRTLWQPIVIDNRPVRPLRRAAQMAAAKPDGYTLAQIPIPLFLAPFHPQDPNDPREFSYVIRRLGLDHRLVGSQRCP